MLDESDLNFHDDAIDAIHYAVHTNLISYIPAQAYVCGAIAQTRGNLPCMYSFLPMP